MSDVEESGTGAESSPGLSADEESELRGERAPLSQPPTGDSSRFIASRTRGYYVHSPPSTESVIVHSPCERPAIVPGVVSRPRTPGVGLPDTRPNQVGCCTLPSSSRQLQTQPTVFPEDDITQRGAAGVEKDHDIAIHPAISTQRPSSPHPLCTPDDVPQKETLRQESPTQCKTHGHSYEPAAKPVHLGAQSGSAVTSSDLHQADIFICDVVDIAYTRHEVVFGQHHRLQGFGLRLGHSLAELRAIIGPGIPPDMPRAQYYANAMHKIMSDWRDQCYCRGETNLKQALISHLKESKLDELIPSDLTEAYLTSNIVPKELTVATAAAPSQDSGLSVGYPDVTEHRAQPVILLVGASSSREPIIFLPRDSTSDRHEDAWMERPNAIPQPDITAHYHGGSGQTASQDWSERMQ